MKSEQRTRGGSPKGPSYWNVHEAKLRNGLRVRLVPSSAVPTVSYYTLFRVGSRNERPGITGISHLFEHMMFNGSKRYGPGEFDRVLEAVGGTSNAYTSQDMTVYHDDFAAEALEQVVDLESDRMRALRIDDRALESERQVVIEERRSRVDNEIYGLMEEELGSMVFRAHPYRWPIIGWQSDIEAIRKQDCTEYFGTYYAPNNAVIFVVGAMDPKATLKLIEKHYAKIPAGPTPPSVPDDEPEQKGERRSVVRHPAEAPSLLVGFRAPRGNEQDALVLDVIQYALSIGQSSRLTRHLVYEKELAVSVMLDWAWRFGPGVFTIYLELKPGADPIVAERALQAELDVIAREGLPPRDLEKAINNLKSHALRELATNSARGNSLGNYEMMLGSWRDGLALTERYAAITADEVKAVAAKYLRADRRCIVTLDPT